MSYRVNEIFCSLQGEGHRTGRAAAFVRFSGCNLKCAFCDTDFAEWREMSAREIVDQVSDFTTRYIILTGGEPTLHVDTQLTTMLHDAGFEIAMETNGTRPIPPGIDWSTVSPKGNVVVEKCSELKVLFGTGRVVAATAEQALDELCSHVRADFHYLQPCDTGDAEQNRAIIADCVDFILRHPLWRLSLQTHKLAGFK